MSRQMISGASSAAMFTAVLLAVSAPGVHAEPLTVTSRPGPSATRTVSYADLNLASTAGQQTLNRRIAGAVRSVCSNPMAGQLSERSADRRCAAEARKKAEPQAAAAIRAHTRAASATMVLASAK